jgi:hypothetical protein
VFGVTLNTILGELQSIFRAIVDALATADAFLAKGDNFNVEIYPLGIMAPMAVQRATFEENGRPDVRPIVKRISLDGKNC